MFLIPLIKVKKTPGKGKGVFATTEIPGGTVLADYIGIVTKPDEGKEYGKGLVYDMWYSDKADICPDPEEPGAHMLNTSCESNCGMSAVGRHTIIFALRTLFPGEELTYDYFLGEQDEDDEPGTDNCMCGSELCKGTMFSNPQHYEAWDEYITELIGSAPEKPPVPFGERLPPLKSYPKSIEDHPIYNLFGSRAQPPLECLPEVLSSLKSVRQKIRNSGRTLSIPKLGILVEGVTYGGHMLIKHLKKQQARSARPVRKLVTA